jgi:hypothetical protein
LQGNRPPKVKNRQIRLLQHTQSASPLKGFRILHGRLNQINAGLSAEKPLVNASTAAELLFHLELAASALTPTWH